MIDLTVLLPHRDAPEEVLRLAPKIGLMLARRERPFEIICIDDGSELSALRQLERFSQQTRSMRLLHLDRPSGLSAALTAGIAAARGELVAVMESSGQYLPEQIPWLVERLARADLVFGRRQLGRPAKLAQAVAQLPRRMLLGLEARDPDCLFWAARREAVAGLDLAPGMHRLLGSLVTTRGYRVAEMHVDHSAAAAGQSFADTHPSLGNLLSAWWQRRNWRPYCVTELGTAAETRRLAA